VVPAGHGVSVTQGEVKVRELPAAETHKELAWQSGMLLFEGDPLSKVADEFNRYNRRKLMVVDVDLAPLKIGGYFKATNLDVFVRVLERDFGVQAALEGNRIALRSGTDGK
jgi:transmembrane sensor